LTHIIKDNTILAARGTCTKCNSVKEKILAKIVYSIAAEN
jgi:hypothetical protein